MQIEPLLQHHTAGKAVLADAHDDFTSPNLFLDLLCTADIILLSIISLQVGSWTLLQQTNWK